jgi:hypothetical protein
MNVRINVRFLLPAPLKGDATNPRGAGLRIVAHIVSNRGLVWGAGFGRAVRKKWPKVQDEFAKWAVGHHDDFHLGNIRLSRVDDSLLIAHLVAQHGVGPSKDTSRVQLKVSAKSSQTSRWRKMRLYICPESAQVKRAGLSESEARTLATESFGNRDLGSGGTEARIVVDAVRIGCRSRSSSLAISSSSASS